MTPGEFREITEAFEEREKREWFKMAWFTSYLLQPHLKRGRSIDPETLLPKSMQSRKKPKTKDEARRELAEIKRNVGMTD